jgi:transcriptional regulator with XRE-family HTH domain
MRLERGLSQGALAGEGMSVGYLSRLERGERPPTPGAVAHLSARLGVAPSAFDDGPAAPARRLARLLAESASCDSTHLPRIEGQLLEALKGDDGALPEERWQALWLLAEHASRQGDLRTELDRLHELADVGDELAAPDLAARVQTRLARCHRTLGDMEPAQQHAALALDVVREHQLGPLEQIPALLAAISVEAELGRLGEADAHVADALPLVKEVAGPLAAQTLWTAAGVASRRGDQQRAQQLLDDALGLLSSHDDLTLWMRLRLAAASLHLRPNPPNAEAASLRLAEAEPAVALIGTDLHRQELTSLRARLAFATGDFAEARAQLSAFDADGPNRLAFRDTFRLDQLRLRLRILDGDISAGVAGLRALAQRAQDARNFDLAAETWQLVADTLTADAPAR